MGLTPAVAAEAVDFGGERRQPVGLVPAQVGDARQPGFGVRQRRQRGDGVGQFADVRPVQLNSMQRAAVQAG